MLFTHTKRKEFAFAIHRPAITEPGAEVGGNQYPTSVGPPTFFPGSNAPYDGKKKHYPRWHTRRPPQHRTAPPWPPYLRSTALGGHFNEKYTLQSRVDSRARYVDSRVMSWDEHVLHTRLSLLDLLVTRYFRVSLQAGWAQSPRGHARHRVRVLRR